MEDFLLHGHEYEYDIDWIVCTLKRHGVELSQIDQKIKDAVKLELSDERITALVIDIISNASGIVNVKIPPEELTPATGDGSANDTAAIQGCIDYVHQKGEGAVFFPSGKYLTNSLTLYDNVALVGESRYTTSLVAAMGSRNVVIGENASMVSIANMTLDGNQPYQVNDIDGVALTGKDWLFTNLIVKDVFRAFVLTLEEEHCQMDNVVIEGVGDSAITILGGKEVQMHQVHVSGISSTIGQYGIEVTSDHAWMTDMVIDSQIPVGLILNGDMCYFEGYVYGVTEPYRDGGNSNSITIIGVSKKEVFNDQDIESTVRRVLNATDTIINSDNPITYSHYPTRLNSIFNTIPMKDSSGEQYQVLVNNGADSIDISLVDYISLESFLKTQSFDEAMTSALQLLKPHGTIFIPTGTYQSAGIEIRIPCHIIGDYTGWTYLDETKYVTKEQYRQVLIEFTESTGIKIKTLGVTIEHISLSGSGIVGIDYDLTDVNSSTGMLRFEHVDNVSMNLSGEGSIGVRSNDIILSTFKNMHVYGCETGFQINTKSANSTSLVFENVWVQGYTKYGFFLENVYYTSFLTCAADSIAGGIHGYYLKRCRTTSFVSCGCEITQKSGWRIEESNQIKINGFSYRTNEGGIGGAISLINSKNVIVEGFTLSDPASTRLGIETDESSTWKCTGCNFFTLYKNGQVITINGGNTENYFTTSPALSPTIGVQNFSYVQSNYGKIYLVAIIHIPDGVTENTFTIDLPFTSIYNDKGVCIGPSIAYVNTTGAKANIATINEQTFAMGDYLIMVNYTPEPL